MYSSSRLVILQRTPMALVRKELEEREAAKAWGNPPEARLPGQGREGK